MWVDGLAEAAALGYNTQVASLGLEGLSRGIVVFGP